jgi:hypothetical protein
MPAFQVGQHIRYRPGAGTYGYEDALEADGRLPGVILGFSTTRVRVELTLKKRWNQKVVRAVDAASLRGES